MGDEPNKFQNLAVRIFNVALIILYISFYAFAAIHLYKGCLGINTRFVMALALSLGLPIFLFGLSCEGMSAVAVGVSIIALGGAISLIILTYGQWITI